eukprot:TRINITY_DN418_c0_g1_i1.p3 TRINITY_DN418_c0_g1~~TRINITY_DN418_c0_g1_i1.p3  ORF type:complete len:106 (-),score=7.12 TRINITY_DN418_c0_g1_i1:35-352(-)
MYSGPSFSLVQLDGDALDFGVVGQAVLAELAANAGFFVSAERIGSVENVVAVDPHGCRSGSPWTTRRALPMSRVMTPAPRPNLELVGPLDDLVQGLELDDGLHGN